MKQITPTLSPSQVANVAIAAAKAFNAFTRTDLNEDGKTTAGEVLTVLLGNLAPLLELVTNAKAAFQSFRAFRAADRRLVVAAFADEFDLENDLAEEKIETVLIEGSEIVTSFLKIISAFKKRNTEA